jgi:hypothetical protein
MNCAIHTQTPAAAYCRTCGKALCEDCKRDVMGAIYCEPCIAARLHGQPISAVPAVPAPMAFPKAPSPAVAALLGCIPGVGAMYNGQFVKALVHVVIFVLLIVATSTLSPFFAFMIAFFFFYMIFEAYKTAEAKRLGLPAPDPLGLDKMFGLQESQPGTPVVIAVPPGTAGAGTPPMQGAAPVQVAPPPPTQDNTPVGAIVLMVLGFVFLLSNFGWLHMRSMWPLILIGFGLWIAYKRNSQQA